MTVDTQLNPEKLLSTLANSHSSGCLELNQGLVSWEIYLQQGALKYICSSVQLLDQLKYYLYYLGFKQAVAALKNLPLPYVKIQLQSHSSTESAKSNFYGEVIPWLIKENHLTPYHGLKLIEQITKDQLTSCLWLNTGTSLWQDGKQIPTWLQEKLNNPLSLSVSKCLNVEQIRLEQWQKCSAKLFSIHQRPYFAAGWEQKSLPTSGLLSHQSLQELTRVIMGRTSIRQLSILLQKDELKVAQILSPYIDYQIINLGDALPPLDRLPGIPRLDNKVIPSSSITLSNTNNHSNQKIAFSATQTSVKTWKIVCIDDSPTILNEMKRFLDPKKFKVIAVDNPVQAVSTVFRTQPDLILLDITMPKINGYKLCTLLRSSENCNKTPIIMVTGNTGVLDKARAKLAGATDYFTKPFTQKGLIEIVQKYLQ